MSLSLEMPAIAVEYLKVPIIAEKAGVTYNPTSDPVSFAFSLTNSAVGLSWRAGSWETVTRPDGDIEYVARCLMPGTLAVGPYVTWIKIVDAPETLIAFRVGILHLV